MVPVASLAPVAHVDFTSAEPSCIPVDRVVVRPGHGALVRALAAKGEAAGTDTYLVSDNGAKYRLSPQALEAFGYTDADVRRLPLPLLSMLASGPDLDPASAARGRKRTTTPACARGEKTG